MRNIAVFKVNNEKVNVEYSHVSSNSKYAYGGNNTLFYLGLTNTYNGDIIHKDMHTFISKTSITKDNVKSLFKLIETRKKTNIYSEDDFFLESYINFYYRDDLYYLKPNNINLLKINDNVHSKTNIYKVIGKNENEIILENLYYSYKKPINLKNIENFFYKSLH